MFTDVHCHLQPMHFASGPIHQVDVSKHKKKDSKPQSGFMDFWKSIQTVTKDIVSDYTYFIKDKQIEVLCQDGKLGNAARTAHALLPPIMNRVVKGATEGAKHSLKSVKSIERIEKNCLKRLFL